MASGTLPTLFINTANRDSILNKHKQIAAKLHIEVPDGSDLGPLGSSSDPVTLKIRGRGNATWTLPKKPYKLKFDQPTEILGMPANRNFALIAWNYGSGNIEWLTSICGMEIARMLGAPWAPHIQPVELILNDNYEGLYFLTESVDIAPGRLEIYEQPAWNEDPATIPYGWLVEFDNYVDDPQIVIPEIDYVKLRITSHSPDGLSDLQRQWLTDEFTSLNDAIYSNGAIDWTERIDLESLARYFIIREITFDTDGFNGSVYLHRDRGDDAKWQFGPLWDIAMGVSIKNDFTMNLLPSFAVAHWIEPMMRNEAFHDEFLRMWNDFYPEKFNRLEAMALRVAEYCEAADAANAVRWPEMSEAASAREKAYLFFSRISSYARWLDANKNWPRSGIPGVIAAPEADVDGPLYDLTGRRVVGKARRGIYVESGSRRLIYRANP